FDGLLQAEVLCLEAGARFAPCQTINRSETFSRIVHEFVFVAQQSVSQSETENRKSKIENLYNASALAALWTGLRRTAARSSSLNPNWVSIRRSIAPTRAVASSPYFCIR